MRNPVRPTRPWLAVPVVFAAACSGPSSHGPVSPGTEPTEATDSAAGASAEDSSSAPGPTGAPGTNAQEPGSDATDAMGSDPAGGGAAGRPGSGSGPASPSTPPPAHDGPSDQDDPSAADDPAADPADPAEQCVIAMRLDSCCQPAVAVTPAEVAADECLVEWSQRRADPELASRCLARSTVDCSVVRCAAPRPASRRVGRGASGECVFQDDCERDADCALGSDATHCCACPESLPAAVIASDPCLLEVFETPTPEIGSLCPQTCPGTCGLCVEPATPTCGETDGVRSCR